MWLDKNMYIFTIEKNEKKKVILILLIYTMIAIWCETHLYETFYRNAQPYPLKNKN